MKRSTKQAILTAGLKLFSEKGYLGATTKEIAKEAGVFEVTLFRHFSNKENLFIFVLKHYSFLPQLQELTKELKNKPLKEALRIIALNFLRELKNKRDLVNIIQGDLKRYPEVLKENFKTLIESLISELAEFLKAYESKGHLRGGNLYLMTQAFFGLFFSYFHCEELKMTITQYTDEEIIEEYLKNNICCYLKSIIRRKF